jgi:bifunctional non-homologous end joining protein LigD
VLAPPVLNPAELIRLQSPFDDHRFIFELKHDGFRALAYVTPNGCRLVSRRGNIYKSFRSLCDSLSTLDCSAVLDGEIVMLDETGRPKFYDLLRRRGEPVFYAFDCLWQDGKDVRPLPLLRRKEKLERIVRAHPSVLFAQHVESFGCQLFDIVRERDLEGIVAKRKDAAYGLDWFKIRNNEYSQYEGRRELFEKRSSRVS